MSVGMVYSNFEKELVEYLQSKLPDLPSYTKQEIGSHISNKVVILVSDLMREYDRELKWNMSKNARQRKYGEYGNDLQEVKNDG